MDALGALGRRLKAVFLVFSSTFSLPLFVPILCEMVRSLIGPGDPAVVLWWPETESVGMGLLFFIALPTALILGGIMLFREPGRWWRLVRWPWLALGVVVVAVVGTSLRSSVLIYPDRLVASGIDRQGYWEELYPFRTAERVEASCRLAGKRRGGARADIGYRVYFPYGDSFSLKPATAPDQPRSLQGWITAVSALDRGALSGADRVVPAEGPSVNCIRTLRTQLDEAEFRAALSLLDISDDEFVRKYAEPHETWRRQEASDAR
ncbi:MAG: hypothetical protein EON85_01525 [Brevundimonas sp.]|nr:MAG: hypothetical protein EON85_01525 [Brevundimonas sp.]